MAAPRVFISSTYYDLRHVREDIGNFILQMGYEPVMHDRGGVTYTQTDTLEKSCYDELSTCDIVICIIGNKYGTKSESSDLSITMEELKSAIKDRKKIYIYILKEVYIENRTYLLNKDNDFKPASVDNIKIHEFVAEIKENIKNHPIETFDNISDIINNLRTQFAGLFQRLLVKEASATEAKTAYDLQESADEIKNSINFFNENMNEFFAKFDATVFRLNSPVIYLLNKLGYSNYIVYIAGKQGLMEYLNSIGFKIRIDQSNESIVCVKDKEDNTIEIIISNKLFDENDLIKKVSKEESKDLIKYSLKSNETLDDYPF